MVGIKIEVLKKDSIETIRKQEECFRLRAELCPSCPFYECDEEDLPPRKGCKFCNKVGTPPDVSSVLSAERNLKCIEKYEKFTIDDLIAISGFNSLDLTKTKFRQDPAVRAVKEKYGFSWSEISYFAYFHTDDSRSRLFLLRKKTGLSQKQLADLVGSTYNRISDYERGITKIENMTLGMAKKLSAALHCTIEDLIGQDELAAESERSV